MNFTKEEQATIREAIELLTKQLGTKNLQIDCTSNVVYDPIDFSPYKPINVNNETIKLYVDTTTL